LHDEEERKALALADFLKQQPAVARRKHTALDWNLEHAYSVEDVD
jgi:hypothetical protein